MEDALRTIYEALEPGCCEQKNHNSCSKGQDHPLAVGRKNRTISNSPTGCNYTFPWNLQWRLEAPEKRKETQKEQ